MYHEYVKTFYIIEIKKKRNWKMTFKYKIFFSFVFCPIFIYKYRKKTKRIYFIFEYKPRKIVDW